MGIELAEDVVTARLHGRELARELGFSESQSTLVVTAISELARNILKYAGAGEIQLLSMTQGEKLGLRITALDRGPGIVNVAGILEGPNSANRGLGLRGLRDIVDDFEISARAGGGVQVVTTIWS
jgi:serine/threonine-protein kinase RsbT